MSRIFVTGLGAVSPAGWGVAALRDALRQNETLPVEPLERPGWDTPLRARSVPAPAMRPEFLAHPRLRRSSPITHYAAAAAVEAMSGHDSKAKSNRLGLVVCVQAGCVRYSCRFLDETIKDPATASPLLFPETVYAAPASHVAAMLGNVTLACSMVGDPGTFLQGICLGVQWLEENSVDACLVIGAEETNWILADALYHLDRNAILTCGAGALCLSRDAATPEAVELAAITDAHSYSTRVPRSRAARKMRDQLGTGNGDELLCDGLAGDTRMDASESKAWGGWPGQRFSPKRVLGDGLMASAAWQCVAACDGIAGGRHAAANVSLVGSNQQAIGARFIRAKTGI